MIGRALLAGAMWASVGVATGWAQGGVPPAVAAAVADSSRPEAEIRRDVDRKPGETLAFAGLKPGDTVVEIIPGGGYFTRILASLVGPSGRVYAAIPPPDPAKPPPAVLDVAQEHANVSVLPPGLQTIRPPRKADVVWTSQNYHDLHNIAGFDMLAFNRSVLAALKPGGVYLVLDHAAAAGAPAETTRTLHRIDPAVARAEIEAAGFRFDGESAALANPGDDHTLTVFDPALRGHTDQFIYRFRKPR